MKVSRIRPRVALLLTLLPLFWVLPSPSASAQQPVPEQNTEPNTVAVYSLKYAKAEEAAKSLSGMFEVAGGPAPRIMADARRNAVIVQGTPQQQKLVEGFLAKIDIQSQRTTQVFQLSNARAEEVADTLVQLLGDRSGESAIVVPDAASNMLIVSATPDAMKQIEQLLKALDRQTEPNIKIFRLRNAAPDESLQGILQIICGNRTRFAIDAPRRQVVVQGDAETLNIAEAVLMRLDEAEAPAPPTDAQLRVVWLAAGLPGDAPPPPEDLQGVVRELERLGLRDVRLVTQVVLSAGREFSTSGTCMLDAPCLLEISGQLACRRPTPSGAGCDLQISIDAGEEYNQREGGGGVGRRRPLCSLQTEIKAPLGHYVVLGVTPIRGMTSAFVVQMQPLGGQPEVLKPARRER